MFVEGMTVWRVAGRSACVFGLLLALTGCSSAELPQSLSPLTTRVVTSTPVTGGNFSIVKDVVTGRYAGIVSGNQSVYPLVSTAPVLSQTMDGTGYTYLIVQGPSSNCSMRADILVLRQGDGHMAHALMPDCGSVRGSMSSDGQTAFFYENGELLMPRLMWGPGRGVYRILSDADRQAVLRNLARKNMTAPHPVSRRGVPSKTAASSSQAPVQEERIENLDHVDDAVLPHAVTETGEKDKKISTLNIQ